MENAKTYVSMLGDILSKKEAVLLNILELTKQQSDILTTEEFMDAFDASVEAKEPLIQELAALDNGFSDAYAKISAELNANKTLYKKDILELQEQIKRLTDIGVRIQALEAANKLKLEERLNSERSRIKSFKVNNKTVSNYYKNMTGKPQGEAYFMDKKK